MYRRYLRLKACPRCGGDILVDRAFEDDEVCIQCGFRKFKVVDESVHSQNLEETTEIEVNGQANRKVVKNL